MGHHHAVMTVCARNAQDAKGIAIDEFFYEYGHQNNLREVESVILVARTPPLIQVKEVVRGTTYIYTKEDNDAPKDTWWGQYEVTLHTHA